MKRLLALGTLVGAIVALSLLLPPAAQAMAGCNYGGPPDYCDSCQPDFDLGVCCYMIGCACFDERCFAPTDDSGTGPILAAIFSPVTGKPASTPAAAPQVKAAPFQLVPTVPA